MRFRRLAVVALAYLAGAFVLDLVLRELVPILVLPPMFMTLARVLVGVGFVVTLAAAWGYTGGDGGQRESRRRWEDGGPGTG